MRSSRSQTGRENPWDGWSPGTFSPDPRGPLPGGCRPLGGLGPLCFRVGHGHRRGWRRPQESFLWFFHFPRAPWTGAVYGLQFFFCLLIVHVDSECPLKWPLLLEAALRGRRSPSRGPRGRGLAPWRTWGQLVGVQALDGATGLAVLVKLLGVLVRRLPADGERSAVADRQRRSVRVLAGVGGLRAYGSSGCTYTTGLIFLFPIGIVFTQRGLTT